MSLRRMARSWLSSRGRPSARRPSAMARTGRPHAPVWRVADGVRIYAIGDVHGRADLLATLFAQIDDDQAAEPAASVFEVMLGDYIDRGADSRGVIDLILARQSARGLLALGGNHEAMLLDGLRDPAALPRWLEAGGPATSLSYGLAPPRQRDETSLRRYAAELAEAIGPAHLAFLESLGTSFASGDYLFVHAGVRPGVALAAQDPRDLIWIRDAFLAHRGPFGARVVHGHSPVDRPEVRTHRINIDTGAFATSRLTCARLEHQGVSFLVAQ